MRAPVIKASYVLPLRTSAPVTDDDFRGYIRAISEVVEVIVVDGSPEDVFAQHRRSWGEHVRHVRPDEDLATPMGKVGGVLTGLRHASFDKVIIADDDIRYAADEIAEVVHGLDSADVVRPQNYFVPLPWHAAWDTGRILLNRVSGGDWPGTLGVSREMLARCGGYDGRVMFENLELVRTIVAAGGRELQLPSTFVARRPSTTRHFWSQRIRQAYDEFARPARLSFQLAWLPAGIAGAAIFGWRFAAATALVIVAAAETGRRFDRGTRVFPLHTILFAPMWVAERAVCCWLAVTSRLVYGGIPYRGTILRKAANSVEILRHRMSQESTRYRSA